MEDFLSEELDGRVQAAIAWKGDLADKNTSGHIDLRSRDLLGFMWLQFARHVIRAEEYVRCPNCDEYFSLARYGLTKNQEHAKKRIRKPYRNSQFCSEICRKEFHYETVTAPARRQAQTKREAGKQRAKYTKRGTGKRAAPKSINSIGE